MYVNQLFTFSSALRIHVMLLNLTKNQSMVLEHVYDY